MSDNVDLSRRGFLRKAGVFAAAIPVAAAVTMIPEEAEAGSCKKRGKPGKGLGRKKNLLPKKSRRSSKSKNSFWSFLRR
ncbi:twin-arginine translocation signal domain-containing protein [Amaricoccus macauensis]|uniref:twin-arginine translocation signal domain-containing protein n=1 Tax=Amaricoccus macauensis TaxID=57001 RepID=UPI003C7BB6E1